jgi:hypothetical protein
MTLLGLVLFGLGRGLYGEWWSLLTALLISVPLFFMASGAKKMAKAHSSSLAGA